MERLPRYFPLERALPFTDGVFAIVITILVLGIEVPSDVTLDTAATAAERERLLHQLLVYFVAFWLTAMYWTQHGLLYAGLRKLDRGLVVLNLMFLLPVTLLPFVTQVMGTRRDDWRSVLVFGLTNLLAAALVERQWKHVLRRPETHSGATTLRLGRRLVWGARFFGGVVIAGIVVSLLNVKAGIVVILIVPLVFFANFIRMGSTPEEDQPGADH